MDLDHVPHALAADDELDQSELTAQFRSTAFNNENSQREYRALSYKEIPLSTMKDIYDQKSTPQAISLLRQRTRIRLADLEYKEAWRDPNLAWDLSSHYLDFILCVSNGVGFDALLPNKVNDLQFNFDLDLHQPHRQFASKHANMGLDGTHRMLYIGRVRGKDLGWLILAPNDYFHETPAAMLSNDSKLKGSSVMSAQHYWMIVICLAHFIAKTFSNGNIYCSKEYPNLERFPRQNVEDSTNLL
jgi:hypothetical protein